MQSPPRNPLLGLRGGAFCAPSNEVCGCSALDRLSLEGTISRLDIQISLAGGPVALPLGVFFSFAPTCGDGVVAAGLTAFELGVVVVVAGVAGVAGVVVVAAAAACRAARSSSVIYSSRVSGELMSSP